VFIENMQENRHTFNMIAQILPNVNNLQELKKTIFAGNLRYPANYL
jgi:hypothetical protein